MRRIFLLALLSAAWSMPVLGGNVIQVAEFPGLTPQQLYDAYLSSKDHAGMTGFPATFYRPSTKSNVPMGQEGDELQAFGMTGADGKLHYIINGRILRLIPGHVVVMSWSATTWGLPDDAPVPESELVLTFRKTPEGAEIRLVQVNVPDLTGGSATGDGATEPDAVNTNWYYRYWEPMRKYFASQAKPAGP
jgi:hypothetical protein